ncbi:MAG: hypothetical protein CMM93_06910 [Rickettsiales bacterium]|nr:hypothetical protein [Rickettsiales bacterium]|tara:strand:+ start:408 stop:821 length:414 start_codon:yes stop_codon:yes gene_type:complete
MESEKPNIKRISNKKVAAQPAAPKEYKMPTLMYIFTIIIMITVIITMIFCILSVLMDLIRIYKDPKKPSKSRKPMKEYSEEEEEDPINSTSSVEESEVDISELENMVNTRMNETRQKNIDELERNIEQQVEEVSCSN